MATQASRGTVKSNPGWGDFRDYTNMPIPGDVIAAVEELGIPIDRRTGDELWGHCPGHLENTGSRDRKPDNWSILVEDRELNNGDVIVAGTHNCFSCGFKGSFVDLVEYVTDMDWDEAKAWVRARGGVVRARKVLERRKRRSREDEEDTTKQINEASLALFTDPPLSACSKRLLDIGSVQHYGVLWNPKKDSWIIPVRDPDTDKLWGWQEKNERFFRNRPRGIEKHRTLFGIQQFRGDTAILLESPLDVVRLHSVGIEGGLGSYGVHFSDEQMELIVDCAEVLIVALDNDSSGIKLSRQIKENYTKRGLTVRFLNYDGTDSKDIGDMTADQIHKAVRTARSSLVAAL